jgi:hypothetical protein
MQLAMVMAFALFAAGCSGINTGTTVSPATFLLPGLLKADSPVTNTLALLPEISNEFVSVK